MVLRKKISTKTPFALALSAFMGTRTRKSFPRSNASPCMSSKRLFHQGLRAQLPRCSCRFRISLRSVREIVAKENRVLFHCVLMFLVDPWPSFSGSAVVAGLPFLCRIQSPGQYVSSLGLISRAWIFRQSELFSAEQTPRTNKIPISERLSPVRPRRWVREVFA